MSTPPETAAALGEGASPPAPPSPSGWGWGARPGRAATSAPPRLAGCGHVSVSLHLHPRHEGRFSERFCGVAKGAKGTLRPSPSSRDPKLSKAAAFPHPRLLFPLSSTLSPHSPHGSGSAWLPQPRDTHCAGASERLAGGGERSARGRGLSRAAQAHERAGARAVGGAGPASRSFPPALQPCPHSARGLGGGLDCPARSRWACRSPAAELWSVRDDRAWDRGVRGLQGGSAPQAHGRS